MEDGSEVVPFSLRRGKMVLQVHRTKQGKKVKEPITSRQKIRNKKYASTFGGEYNIYNAFLVCPQYLRLHPLRGSRALPSLFLHFPQFIDPKTHNKVFELAGVISENQRDLMLHL